MNHLQVIERDNQRVMTTAALADEYGTTERRISENFNANKERYAEGKHFYCLEGEELKEFLQSVNSVVQNPSKVRTLYLWTEKGALLHAKSLGTDRAWEVYEILVDTYFKKQVDLLQGLSTEMKGVIMLDKKFQGMEHRVDKLENTMVVDHGQGKELQDIGKNRAMTILCGKGSKAYVAISKKVFNAIWHDYKDYFNITSYHNTPVARFDEAKEYLKNWMPSNNLQIEINRINRGEIL